MSKMYTKMVAYRGSLLDFVSDPYKAEKIEDSYRYVEDGLLVVEDGKIVKISEYSDLIVELSKDIKIVDYSGKLITPGFIDTHIHYPQSEIIGAYGEQLLEWLNTYTFPAERKFVDKVHAKNSAKFFLDELFRNGITTALVFPTIHPQSVDAFFEESMKYNARMICGKMMMDRNAPDYLLDTPQSSYDESKALIKKWHNKDRFSYAITPRFAPTSTPEQLEAAGALKKEYPDTYVQTHLSENKAEIEWVLSLYPDRKSYLDVYDHYNLLSSKTVLGHCIHLSDEEFLSLKENKSVISFCPTSNLFLGSGLFNVGKALDMGVEFTLATDVGAGTSFSMLQTLNEAYKVAQLQEHKLPVFEGFYYSTLGAATALELGDKIGNFDQGKEADFIVIELTKTPLQKLRMSVAKNIAEKLFVLMTVGDDRNIYATYIFGNLVHERGFINV